MKKILLISTLIFSISALYAQNAPVDFEAGGNGADWTWTVFENDVNPDVNIIANPDPSGANTSATVAEFTALTTGQPFAGTETMHGADIGPFTLSQATSEVRIMVWKSTISDVGIKLVESNGAALPEVKVANTVTDQWEELVFNFSDREGIEFDQIVIFPDFTFDPRPSDNVVYFDNITFNQNASMSDMGCTDPTAVNYSPVATTDDGSCLFAMTFNVDMNCEIGTFGQVELTGPFTQWCGGCIILEDTDGDNIYTTTINVPGGELEYKYSIDVFAGQENLVDDVQAGNGGCAPITDGANYANRLVPVVGGGVIDDTYGTCGVCNNDPTVGCTDPAAENYSPMAITDDGSCSYAVTFAVDMNAVTDAFTTPELNGTFNGFCGNCNPMSDTNGDNIWEVTINLTAGDYDFKYSADAWTIQETLADGSSCTMTTDGFVNRFISVPMDLSNGPVAWGECADAGPCPGDITGDGFVNISDFLAFNSAFGFPCSGCPSDLDGSGVVDVNDFLILNSNFNMTCSGIQNPNTDNLHGLNSDLDNELRFDASIVMNEDLLKQINLMRTNAETSRLYESDGSSVMLRTDAYFGDILSISVLDMNGKSIYSNALNADASQEVQQISFDTTLAKGQYVIAIQTSETLKVDRLFVR